MRTVPQNPRLEFSGTKETELVDIHVIDKCFEVWITKTLPNQSTTQSIPRVMGDYL
jgi:hypothetical protein